MYLADRDIKALGGELNIEGPNPDHPFDPDSRIQPCSIDLRISNVFWRPSWRRRLWRRLLPWREVTIDLRRSSVFAAFGIWTIVLAVLTGMSLLGALAAYLRDDHGYMGTRELRAIKQRPTEEGS